MKGWILLHRSLSEHWLWQCNEPFDMRSAWIDLLFLANFKECKELYRGELVQRKRGEISCSQMWLADRWKWDRRKVSKFLKILEADNMVSIISTTQGTTITVENYSKYQFDGATDDATNVQRMYNECTTVCTHKNKGKESKKNAKEIYKGLSDELQSALKDFEEMRKRKNKPMTDRARTLLLNKLNSMADTDAEKIAILEQSTMNAWSSVYELKGRTNETERNNNFGTGNEERNRMGRSVHRSESEVPCFEDGTPIRSYGLAKGFSGND